MISSDRPGPPSRRLAGILRDRISQWRADGRAAVRETLAQEYGLAVNTVRKALALLREEGLIHTDRGWGSYTIGSEPTDRP